MKYLYPAEVALAVGATPQTIRKAAKAGEFKGAIKPQREWLIPESEALAWKPRKRGPSKGRGGRPRKIV